MQINSLHSPDRDALSREVKSALTGWLPRLANGALVVLIAYMLALLTWQLVPRATPEAPPPAPNTPQVKDSVSEDVAGGAIGKVVAMHLFGVPRTKTTTAKAVAMNAPETQLNLTLRGLFAANHPQDSYAIIAVSGGDDKQYGVGARLPSGAKVHAIYFDRVILNRAGQLEALKLPREKQQSASISTNPRPQRSNNAPAFQRRSSSQHAVNIQHLRETIKRQPHKLIQVLRPAPVTKNGKLIGYRVYPGKDSQTFTALGLKSGDIIKSINGIALNDPEQSVKILKQLSTAGQLNATVERDGKEQSLTLSLSNQ